MIEAQISAGAEYALNLIHGVTLVSNNKLGLTFEGFLYNLTLQGPYGCLLKPDTQTDDTYYYSLTVTVTTAGLVITYGINNNPCTVIPSSI
jgi:hypothetical protein